MPFLGMRGNDNWATDQRPKDWRETILYLFPNGNMPLTAIQSKASKRQVMDPEYNWWTKALQDRGGAITGVYTNVNLSTAYTSGGVAGNVLYVKCAEATAGHFAQGKEALLRYSADLNVDVVAKVVDVAKNGANSYVACKLLEADDNSASYDLSDADLIMVKSNINPEGGLTPDSIAYDPVKYSNYTQIFRMPLEITRTARKTRLRTGDQYKQAKQEALWYHGVDMEWAAMFGIKTENTGDNGLPERTTQGIRPFLVENLPANVLNYISDSNYSGQDWLTGGDDWILDLIELLFRYDDGMNGEFVGVLGSGSMKAIERLVKAGAQMNIQPAEDIGYGVKVSRLVTSFGDILLKRHPLMSQRSELRNSALFYKPNNFKVAYIDDTEFYGTGGKNYAYHSNGKRIDGINEEFLTEMGFEMHHPQMFLWADGFGETNTA